MGDIFPEPGEARVSTDESRNVQATLTPEIARTEARPEGSDPAAEAGDADATILTASPLFSGRAAQSAPAITVDGIEAATIISPPAESGDAATIISSAPLAGSVGPNRPISDPKTSAAVTGRPVASGLMFEVGTLLGARYEILKLLGQGGMGAVYKAADREVDRIVALKVIRPEMASDPEVLGRFKQELLLSSKVTHRNVIRIYDIGEAQGTRFITMEYLDGETLHQLLKRRQKLEVAEAVDIVEQVSCGLAAAHQEGIIHRDLKPANIMIETSGRAVLMDFGLARTFSGDGMTQAGTMLGTMEYMSPEQAQGKDVKASSDIFTLGLILYELLAGTTPFRADSAIASLLMRTQQRAAPLVNVDKNIPGTLSSIVSKCLEKDPARRYQSAEHLNADLHAWQVGSGAKYLATSSPRRASQVGRLPWVRIAAGVLVVAVAAGGTRYFIARQRAAKAHAHGPVSVLIGDFENHTGDPVLDNTLEPMLGVAMEGASFINVYSRGDARKLAKKLPNPSDVLDEQTSRLVAINQGVNAVITGDISRRGDQYDISAIALDAQSGDVLAKAEESVADKQAILSELPKLAAPLRQALGDTTPPSQQFDKVSGGFTAASLEAVHQDALGVEEQFAGKSQEAFDSFQKAAELDPKFARAYSGMGAMANNLGRHADAVKYMKLAMENKDRMTERELYRNQGLYYLTLGDWQKCVEQYTQLVERYPADRVGQNNLAECYVNLRNAPKALEAAKHAVEIVPRGVTQRLNLAFIEAFASDFPASEKDARAALDINPDALQAHLVLAEAELGEGQLQQASDKYHKLATFGAPGASTAADGLADLAAYQGQYAEAAQILTQGAASDVAAKMTDNAARKYASLATIEELEGQHASAMADIAKALAGSQSTAIQFLAARLYVDAGDLPKAQKLAAGLAAQQSSEPQAYGKIIDGMIALQRRDADGAVSQIIAANKLLDTWIGHFELGRAYLSAAEFKRADAEFEECVRRRGEAIELFNDNVPTYAYFPAVYYYDGRAREGMKSANFADAYKQYLSIRGQSKDDPLVAAARQALAP
jgi:tetratricopeptide (TPR) repeat protein/predicted Ser/Thr protein kinase